MVVPILQGRLRGKRWIVGSSNHGCWLGSYEYEKQRRITDTVEQGSVVYDIGANVGFYTILFSALVGKTGRVVAFEPGPESLPHLRRHVRLNRCKNVSVQPVALGDYSGRARFELGTGGNSTAYLSQTGGVSVPIFRLDDWVQKAGAPHPDYLKIDIEGAEAAVLEGALRTLWASFPTIFLATHGPDVHHRCCELLVRLGYQLSSLTMRGIAETDELLAVHPQRRTQVGLPKRDIAAL